MSAGLRVEIDDEALRRALAAIDDRLENPRPMWDEIGAALVASVQHRFETESAPGGNPWPKSIRARVEGGQTLTETGQLRRSITHIAEDDAAIVGTNAIYAAVHQFGAVIRAKTAGALRFVIAGVGFVMKRAVRIPARPFLGIDDGDRVEIARIAEAFIARPEATP